MPRQFAHPVGWFCKLAIFAALMATDASMQAADWLHWGQRSSDGPKTLFKWSSAEEEAEEEPEDDKIVTDRPHFSEASSLVGLGRAQIETGYTYARDSSQGVVFDSHSFPEALLRVGLFAEWFEFRIQGNVLSERERSAAGTISRSGADDLYLGAKLALTEQSGVLPEIALFPQTRLPTGASSLTSGEPLPGFNLAYSWMLTDWLELECNTQLNRRREDSGHFYAEFIQTANVEVDLTERVMAFTEWFCLSPCGGLDSPVEHYLHSGLQFFLTNYLQFDIHVGVGLNRASLDLPFAGVGLSAKF